MGYNDVIAAIRKRQMAPPPSRYSTVEGVTGAHDALIDSETEYGRRGTDAFLRSAENFDASAALNKYASGAWGSIGTALKDQLADVRGGSVGAGRFDSGFLDEDQGTVINRATQQFSNAVAQQSMGALGAQQRNTESLGAFGNERSGRATDLLLSREEQVMNDAREEEERRRKSRGGIAGAIGGALGAAGGFLVGGIPGAQAGYGIGSGIGRGVGG